MGQIWMKNPAKTGSVFRENQQPFAQNSRLHSEAQIKQLARSITEFGFTNPILIAPDGTIIAGHGRLAAAKLLKLDQVPTITLGHLTETQRRALVIADNRLAENSSWSFELLKLEMDAIAADGFDLSVIGFSIGELGDIFDPEGGGDAPIGDEERPEPKPVTCPECGAHFVAEKKGRRRG
jgi:hypothetical protein